MVEKAARQNLSRENQRDARCVGEKMKIITHTICSRNDRTTSTHARTWKHDGTNAGKTQPPLRRTLGRLARPTRVHRQNRGSV